MKCTYCTLKYFAIRDQSPQHIVKRLPWSFQNQNSNDYFSLLSRDVENNLEADIVRDFPPELEETEGTEKEQRQGQYW